MKILMLGWEFPPAKSGGLGTHCYELVRNLGKKGAHVLFFMPKKPPKMYLEGVELIGVDYVGKMRRIVHRRGPVVGPYPEHVVGPYISQIGPYYNPKARVLEYRIASSEHPDTVEAEDLVKENYGWDLFNEVMRYNQKCVKIARKESFDVIHCHDWITVQAGIELKKAKKRPLVFTVHSTEYDRTASIYPMDWIIDVEKRGIDEADVIITVSNYMKQQLIDRYNADEKKIVVIYNGIDLEKYANAEKMIGKKNILFLGRLTNQKGAYFFLHAAKIVLEKEKDVSFIIVGKGDQMPELINLAIELGIHDKVRFTGYIPEEQIPLAYAHCNAYVMPSITEPFGITALEAMATGTPLIVSKNAGVSETVKHCFKVDFWDTHEMANKIVSILRYPVLEKVMGENSKKEVVSFGWDKVAEQTLSTYGRFA